MIIENIKPLFLKKLEYTPTSDQETLIDKMPEFLNDDGDKKLFLIKGYAGTGKTTFVSTLIKILPSLNKKSILLAPTGRAAKVLANYSNKTAFTIHKKIYKIESLQSGNMNVVLQKNKHTNTIFIVDEASMIPDSSGFNDSNFFSQRNLLEDLFDYVFQGKNCKLILIGDSAQLPPVGLDISPALNIEYLKNHFFNISISSYELREVVRQSKNSGILSNATNLRKLISNNFIKAPFFFLQDYTDIQKISGEDLEDLLYEAYSSNDIGNSVVICRSNKRANIFNQEIRRRILYKEDEISAGDFMMVVKNNYFWLPSDSKAGFIANGDIIEILKIKHITDLYGFRFADVTIRLIDYPDEGNLDTKILLDTISTEAPGLKYEDSKRFFNEIMQDYIDIPQKNKRYEKLKNNPYFNALHIKFSYSLTCHKTQGGQWDTVFVDQGYINENMINKEYLRWLYTAITRATKRLYLLNFNEDFFETTF